jgi:hypothetical protein
MPIGVFNDTIDAGSDYLLQVLDQNPDGTPVDLTGCTARMQLRRHAGAATADLDLTSSPAAGITITAEEGQIDVRITAAQTANLSWSYVYALEVTGPGGYKDRLLQGLLVVAAGIIRT